MTAQTMKIKPINISFTETAQQEIDRIIEALSMRDVVKGLAAADLPEDLKRALVRMTATIGDIFSLEVPLPEPAEIDMLKASRDINLSRALREKGIVRLYRLTHNAVDVDLGNGKTTAIRAYQLLANPDLENNNPSNPDLESNNPFTSQEEFLTWFCREASVSRPLIFQRFAAYDRLQALGYSLPEAFETLITKPFVILDVVKTVPKWSKDNDYLGVEPEVARNLATKILPPGKEQDEILELLDKQEAGYDINEDLADAMIPVLRRMIDEVASHPSARDARAFIKHDILREPEIRYTWLEESGGFAVELLYKSIDENGTEGIDDIFVLEFFPDTVEEIPREIMLDLVSKLHVTNRNRLDLI